MAISLSKLDLSFLGKKDPSAIERGRFRYDAEEGVIPAWRHQAKHWREPKRGDVELPYYVCDVDAAYGGAWKSIIDGSEISSRSNWKEHNRRNQVEQVGPGYWGENADRDIVKITEERMGYDPSERSNPDFSWVEPKI